MFSVVATGSKEAVKHVHVRRGENATGNQAFVERTEITTMLGLRCRVWDAVTAACAITRSSISSCEVLRDIGTAWS